MMKTLKNSLLIVMAFIALIVESVSAETYTITVHKQPVLTDQIVKNVSHEGHRTPPIAIVCTISDTDGLYISTLDNDEILMFGIYDENGNCIASYYNEADFISALFTLSGTYEVQFTTEDYTYVGYISL
jgi:lipoprotein-anchoring transpeptidase ErfK/SrfK